MASNLIVGSTGLVHAMARLVDTSLIVADVRTLARYRMFETVREFGRDQSADAARPMRPRHVTPRSTQRSPKRPTRRYLGQPRQAGLRAWKPSTTTCAPRWPGPPHNDAELLLPVGRRSRILLDSARTLERGASLA